MMRIKELLVVSCQPLVKAQSVRRKEAIARPDCGGRAQKCVRQSLEIWFAAQTSLRIAGFGPFFIP
jgi:hypothetical protein